MTNRNEMNENRYVLILGAGLMQRPSIEAARELGFKALVIDANPKACCVPYADRFECVDLKDKEGIYSLAKSLGENLAAIFTAGTDFSASVSYAAERLGLPCHSYEAALNASNKIRMRQCFKTHNIPSPDFFEITGDELSSISEEKILSMKFPKVVKPVDNMGARGCRLVRTPEEFLPSAKAAVSFSRTGKAIVEDYMEGPEFSIDALVYDGNVTITGFADRHIFFEPYFIELGHTMPSEVSDEMKKELCETFSSAVKALGLTYGVAKGDIKYTKSGPMIGEIAARLSGGYMSGWTFPYASGCNLTKTAMEIALGKKPEETNSAEVECKKFSHERAFISIPGRVERIYGQEDIHAVPFIKNIFFRVKENSCVDFPRNNVEKCGNVITLSERRDLSLKAAESAVSKIVLRLSPNNAETDKFLSGAENPDEKGFPYSAYNMTEEIGKEFEKVTIAKNESVSKKLQSILEKISDNQKDWNHRTVSESVKMFDEISPEHCELSGEEFFRALNRGGIQGILYLSDCKK